jgi:hypothetical protein
MYNIKTIKTVHTLKKNRQFRTTDENKAVEFKTWSMLCNVKFPHHQLAMAHSPNISRSSCALPSANTGIKHLPPRFTMSWTRAVNRLSRSSRFSWMWVPYVDSYQESNRKWETPQYWTEMKYSRTPISADSVSMVSVICGLPWPKKIYEN